MNSITAPLTRTWWGGNKIGTDVTGTLAVGNASHGIRLCCGAGDNAIGGALPGEANIIAFNGGSGVVVQGLPSTDTGAIHNRISGNSIFENTLLGIDLGNDGVTAVIRVTAIQAPMRTTCKTSRSF